MSSTQDRSSEIQKKLLRLYRDSGLQALLEEACTGALAKAFTTKDDPWKTLGVDPVDPPELVDAVWREKAKFFHPDNPHTGNRERFEAVRGAYSQIIAMREDAPT